MFKRRDDVRKEEHVESHRRIQLFVFLKETNVIFISENGFISGQSVCWCVRLLLCVCESGGEKKEQLLVCRSSHQSTRFLPCVSLLSSAS